MIDTVDSCVSAGDIARLLKEKPHRIEYVLATRKHIKAVKILAGARIYPGHVVGQIRDELARMDSRRSPTSL